MIKNIHPDYEEQPIQDIEQESKIFSSLVNELASYTNNESPTNKLWLGTLDINGHHTQIQLVITQAPQEQIDEN